MKPKILLCLALVLSSHCRAAIVFPVATEDGRQFAYVKVKEVLQAFPNAFKGLKISDLTMTNALKVYDTGPKDIVSGHLLSAAELFGWQYLFIHGTNAVCEVPLAIDPQDGKLIKRGGVSSGEILQATLVALQKAAELPQVKKQDYECRYLTVPFLFEAIWLHEKSDDIIIPLPPTWGEWNAYQPYSESEIIKLLKPEAENKLKQNPDLPD